MKLTDQIHPTSSQLKQLFETFPSDTPISMLNIVRFKENVEEKGLSGQAVYQSYMEAAMPFIKIAEGKLIWKGEVHSIFIGDEEGSPQAVFIVNYPTIEHFKLMISNPEYQKIASLRTMSIEYGGLIATTQQYPTT